jgi:hemoglobin
MNLLNQRIGGHEGISKLLRHFYADVRQHPLIGSIFNAKIKDWKHHLEIITKFWETLIGGPSSYAGPMPMKHLPLRLREEDFERWLLLWQANCRAQLCPAMSRKK